MGSKGDRKCAMMTENSQSDPSIVHSHLENREVNVHASILSHDKIEIVDRNYFVNSS